jgi:hypothetical protein
VKSEITTCAAIVKSAVLVAVAPPTETEILPVVAPVGTAKLSRVDVAEITEAELPFTLTLLAVETGSKPAPVTLTTVPTRPTFGSKSVTASDTADPASRIETRSPAAPYSYFSSTWVPGDETRLARPGAGA